MLTNKQETNIAFSQRDLIRIDDRYRKLNKLRILYKSNRRRNNKLILQREIKRLTKIVEKLTH